MLYLFALKKALNAFGHDGNALRAAKQSRPVIIVLRALLAI